MNNKNILFFGIILLALSYTSCDKEPPEIPNDEELITTLTYTLTPLAGGEAIVLQFSDLDGEGGNEPILTGGALEANTSYLGALDLLNESVDPAESITAEIAAEDEEHQFFFQTSLSDLVFSYSDLDADNNPVGLSTTLTTGMAASGTITIILRHEPKKNEAGVADGDITNADGETDIQVTFPIDVQ